MLPVEVGSSLQAINVNYLKMEFNSAYIYQPFDNLFNVFSAQTNASIP